MGSEGLYDLLVERLETSDLRDETRLLVLAAYEGDAALAEALQRQVDNEPEPNEEPTSSEPVAAYLSAITVRAFRGIGPVSSWRKT